jgi:cytochrome c biogenesis protein CcdA
VEEQSLQNHSKVVPTFHYLVFGILTVNLLWSIYRLIAGAGLPLFDRILSVLMAVALAFLALHARLFALKVQDRVIRLEERLRLRELLPADLRPRIGELSAGQLVALRFASDEELPELTRKVMDEKIRDRREIKKRIRTWRADHLRA